MNKTMTPWYGEESIKSVRRVRTPGGVERFGQPLGTIIIADLPEFSTGPRRATRPDSAPKTPATTGPAILKQVESEFEGWDKYSHSTGDYYVVEDEDGEFLVTDPDDNVLFSGATKAKAMAALRASLKPKTTPKPRAKKDTTPPKYSGGTKAGVPLKVPTDEELAQFRADTKIPIPPAWTDLKITTDPENAALLITGKAANGKVQYLYSTAHRDSANGEKFKRTMAIHKSIPKLDKWIEENLEKDDTAIALLLMRVFGMRPGGEKSDVDTADSYGATTLLMEHISVTAGGKVTLKFRPGKKHSKIEEENIITITSNDKTLARAMKILMERNKSKSRKTVALNTSAAKAGAAIKRAFGDNSMKAKDLRTYVANRIAMEEMAKTKKKNPQTKKELDAWINEVAAKVSDVLGNEPSEARKSYINPEVFDKWTSALESK